MEPLASLPRRLNREDPSECRILRIILVMRVRPLQYCPCFRPMFRPPASDLPLCKPLWAFPSKMPANGETVRTRLYGTRIIITRCWGQCCPLNKEVTTGIAKLGTLDFTRRVDWKSTDIFANAEFAPKRVLQVQRRSVVTWFGDSDRGRFPSERPSPWTADRGKARTPESTFGSRTSARENTSSPVHQSEPRTSAAPTTSGPGAVSERTETDLNARIAGPAHLLLSCCANILR